jgi:predicted butyrate kinase (DUF1464 family)
MTKPKKLMRFDVESVANGYIVAPCMAGDRGRCLVGEEIRVFESFGTLVEWLRAEIGEAVESPESDT